MKGSEASGLRLFPMTCGWLTAELGGFLAGESGRIKVPVPCFLIDHPRGKVLFDAGLHPHTQEDPQSRLGALAAMFEVDFQAGEEVAARLESAGAYADKVDHLILSHLHFDHAGGACGVPNARLIVQRREWEAAAEEDAHLRYGYNEKDYGTGQEVFLLDGEHDFFGDGRVVCLPTHGHTPGHQSLLVRLDSGDVVLSADACYLRRTLEELHLPSVVADPDAMRESLLKLRRLRDAGARIVFGHDPDDWAAVPQVPDCLGAAAASGAVAST